MTFATRPLWSLSTVNDDVLPESTPRDFEFKYVDISSVTTGAISSDLQTLTFGGAPSRARRLAVAGDVVVSTVRTYLRAIAPAVATPEPTVYSTGFAVLRPDSEIMDSRFFQYALLAGGFIDQITSHSVGVSYPAINASDLMRFSVPTPVREVQPEIAEFLDRETAEIDAMDAELDRLVEALRVRRTTSVAGAVKLHVDTDELPPGWTALPFKFAVESRFTGEWGGEPGTGEVDVLCVRVADFDRATRTAGSDVSTIRSIPKAKASAKALRPGDLLLERSGGTDQNPVGNVILYVGPEGAISSNFVECVRLLPDHDSNFWRYVHEAAYSTGFTQVHVRQTSGIQNLDAQGFYDESFAVPNLKDQQRLAAELDEQTARIDDMIADANHLKSLLAERRSTLITDIVTGAKEVPA